MPRTTRIIQATFADQSVVSGQKVSVTVEFEATRDQEIVVSAPSLDVHPPALKCKAGKTTLTKELQLTLIDEGDAGKKLKVKFSLASTSRSPMIIVEGA